ncbi:hypothetical protein OWM54_17695 [Myxococcus sp. MISCRS1]|uniref:hypothetical protein n=1 Tax=Myxococcus sp. MISCRS1 TaxID=2996786 RepID=UPI00226F81D3|nr:hypothetical protein [Myxococcus sp. MISCRS1]MCY0998977.1 hypothetical protein [Myxococcus sp. MISCRS1]
MRDTRRWRTRSATPEDVLALLRAKLAHDAALDASVEEDPPLDFETPLSHWEAALDAGFRDFWLGWKPLAAWLQSWLYVEVPPHALDAALRAHRAPTMGHLCEFLAPRLRLPVLEPLRVAGTSCLTAGAFITLRTALLGAGLPVARARPSTPLSFQSWQQLATFQDVVGLLSPRALPRVEIPSTPFRRASLGLFVLALVSTAAGYRLGSMPLFVGGMSALLGVIIAAWLRPGPAPGTARFPGVTTLGDVARLLAASASTR